MLKLIETLRAKPSDRNIRIFRTVFALILIIIITGGITHTDWNYDAIPDMLVYILYIFPLIGLIRGILDPGIVRRKIWKWTVVGLGLAMMILTLGFLETDTDTSPEKLIETSVVSGEGISLASLESSGSAGFIVDTDFWIGFLGFWVSLFGLTLTSKNITKKNERFGEKVTKIRV